MLTASVAKVGERGGCYPRQPPLSLPLPSKDHKSLPSSQQPAAIWPKGTQPCSRTGRGGDGLAFWAVGLAVAREEPPLLVLQVRMVRGELVDESGGSPLEWIGLIRAARNPQEQTLEAIADLPGGQVLWASHCQFHLPDRHQC